LEKRRAVLGTQPMQTRFIRPPRFRAMHSAGEGEGRTILLAPCVFTILSASLVCLALVPAAYWLADESLLPWPEEFRWEQLRAHQREAAVPVSGSVQLIRTGCFGPCASYSVTVHTTGQVDFHGYEFVCQPGKHSARIPGAAATELVADIAEAGFLDPSWNKGNYIADATDLTVTLVYGDRSRSLPHIDAESNSPRLLRTVGAAIDEVAGTSRWLPRRIERDLVCEFADGSRKHFYDMQFPTR
jgi:hypothetical protein